jgi:hypothetical protein
VASSAAHPIECCSGGQAARARDSAAAAAAEACRLRRSLQAGHPDVAGLVATIDSLEQARRADRSITRGICRYVYA